MRREGALERRVPGFLGEQFKPLPGWKSNGKKDRAGWDGDNPTKATFKAWLQFVKENFPGGGGQAASVVGAPDSSDYQDSARKGAGP